MKNGLTENTLIINSILEKIKSRKMYPLEECEKFTLLKRGREFLKIKISGESGFDLDLLTLDYKIHQYINLVKR